MNKLKLTVLLITTAIFLTACQDKEAGKLDNRVLAYWNYKINKDFKSAYQFLSPGWRESESKTEYSNRMEQNLINWKSAKIVSKECSKGNICKVKVIIIYEYMFRGAISKKMTIPTNITENWIMINNTWYMIPVKNNFGKN